VLCNSEELREYRLGRVLESLTWPERKYMVYVPMYGSLSKSHLVRIQETVGPIEDAELDEERDPNVFE
jgi:hypothetical protein